MHGNSGFSFVEALIVPGIMAFISVMMASTLVWQMKGANSTGFIYDAAVFNQEVRALLTDPGACVKTFAGQSIVPAAAFGLVDLFDKSGGAQYATGKVYENNSVLLSSMLTDAYIAGPTVLSAIMTLKINLNSAKSASGPQTIQRVVNIEFTLNGAGGIISCIALPSMSDGIWQHMVGNIGNIFYVGPSTALNPGTNVGIGTSAPTQRLDVWGDPAGTQVSRFVGQNSNRSDVQLLNSNTPQVWALEVNGSTPPFAAAGDFGIERMGSGWSLMIQQTSGNVGIGTNAPLTKLDVQGGIRAGAASAGTAYSGNPEGTMAYDGVAHVPIYCDQLSKWAAMGGVKCVNISHSGMGSSTATCPVGTTVVGGGCMPAAVAPVMQQSSPTGTGWTCSASQPSLMTSCAPSPCTTVMTWSAVSVKASAICCY